MTSQDTEVTLKRRDLFRMIGAVAGGSAMYQAMTSLGFAADSQYTGPIKLEGNPKGAKVIVLGAGWAGLISALELRNAGYKVELIEYNNRVGGRAMTIRGGDVLTDVSGETQKCGFDSGLYLNPGPWRIPYHHRGYLDYAKRFGVQLEPFIMINYNAYVHSKDYFGGKPQRFREVQADFQGHVSELLAKTVRQDKLDQSVSKDDQGMLLEALKGWGALDKNYAYVAGITSAERRGYEVNKGGGLMPEPVGGQPIALTDLLKSDVWRAMTFGQTHQWHSTIFQPVGRHGHHAESHRQGPGRHHHAERPRLPPSSRTTKASPSPMSMPRPARSSIRSRAIGASAPCPCRSSTRSRCRSARR